MALLNMFKGGGRKNAERMAQELLSQLAENKTVVRVEIEESLISFPAHLSLRQGSVMVTRPERIQRAISAGKWIRVRGLESGQELRLQISSVTAGPKKTTPFFMCRIPGARAEPPKRKAERWSTGHFKNLLLEIHSHPYRYRVVDISAGGMRIRTNLLETASLFPIGTAFEPGTILLGQKGRIRLDSVIPRFQYTHSNAVGLETVVSTKGNSHRWLEAFLDSLARAAAKSGGAGKSGAASQSAPPSPQGQTTEDAAAKPAPSPVAGS